MEFGGSRGALQRNATPCAHVATKSIVAHKKRRERSKRSGV